MLVSVTAYSAALLALPNGTYQAKQRMYEYILQKDLDDFKTFIDSNVEKIITEWVNPESYKRKCLELITVQHQDITQVLPGFSAFRFYPGDTTWGSCTWSTELNRTLNKTLICEQFAFKLQSKRSSIRTKAETYWNPYKAKLSQSGSIYSTIKTKVTSGSFNNTLLNSITSATVPDTTVADRLETNRP